MIKAILIDDEAFVREEIREKISRFFGNEILVADEAGSVAEGFTAIQNHDPDLLFLDINMGDGTGFDLLKQCVTKNFDIIFITGFDQHAIKAIKVGALDYILKPVDDDEFKMAVQKAIDNYQKDNNLEKLIEISSEYFRGVEKKRVILKTSDTVYAIYEDDIIYCRSDGNYTTFYTQQMEKIVVSKSLKQIEEILSEEVFIRCHQSYVVNKKHVLKYNKQGVLIVNLDFKVPVSSRRKDYALKRIFD
ncbi:LytTR family DNA-binding domain-containing protein [Aureisphaera galaxeae]|uniref:LytR/AlgR family response regulator transcription factor n=1 Tax=Aureisphaera galaxeae TaxID=1538023 RepID=UPI00234FDD6A|nr:LytTR family DNA-binding domain-containing protein [Aureisphaera galaxeae]MDC8003037.1 LytTR family DNA-binding domain-containing protein [Aureisphaera galaxeae]